jgi:predicted  nucleic acid-binding Zn-ribbon protein
MTDNNKNISINVEINASGQQQINQYKGAFDSLRGSIVNLSNPINKLDSDISKLSDSIGQISSKNDSMGESVIKNI